MTLLERAVIRDPQNSIDVLRLRFTQMIVTIAIIFLGFQILRDALFQVPSEWYLYFFLGLFAVVFTILLQRRAVNIITTIVLIGLLLGTLLTENRVTILGLSAILLLSTPVFGSGFAYYFVVPVLIIRTAVFELQNFDAQFSLFATLIPFMIVLILLSFLLRSFRFALVDFLTNSRRTADLLAASATIGQAIGQFLELNTLLNRSVEIVRDRLTFYHVQIFLTDDQNSVARLTASTGDVGKHLLETSSPFPVNSRSLIGRAIQAGEPIRLSDASTQTEYTFYQELPNTRSELVVPIVDGEKIIGALDVHSMRSNAFSKNDVQALEVMANQLALAIRNVRLFEQQEQTVRENKRLFLDSETNLREIERLNRQLTKQAWEDYLRGRGIVAGVTWSQKEFKPGAEWSEQMTQAAQRRRVITNKDENRNQRVIAVPVELRGEVIGAIEIETDDNGLLSDTVDMLQAISQRLAVSIDNSRLFEETQEATAQEQRISEIVSGYQAAESIEDLLQITLEGLAEALGAEQGSIRLGNAPISNGSNGSHQNGAVGETHD